LNKQAQQFEKVTLPHLSAAYNLARWLVRDEHVAQDMVQEAYIRALKYFDAFRGGDVRPWLLGIVRNTCYTWLQGNRHGEESFEFDEDRDSGAYAAAFGGTDNNPEALLLSKQESSRVNFAISSLPPVFREVLVLRELEGMSYEEIAAVAGIPSGTVMSRLARARIMLRAELNCPLIKEDGK
jgi:RNA polymerase sigma-70 factor (ECF subfamily)